MGTVAACTSRGVAAGVGLAAVLAAQSDWRALSPSRIAPPREEAAVATDFLRGRIVMFGGRAADGALLRDTWTWDGTTWRQAAGGGPPARRDAAFAFHPVSGRAVLFGGYDAQGVVLGDTWTWDGTRWTRGTGGGPSPRAATAMALDAGSGDLVLFGGVDAQGVARSDTWRWNGTSWRAGASGATPAARFGHAMTTDPVSGGVLMFGGTGAGHDTWLFAFGSWVNASPSVDPGARHRHAMTTDPARGRVVLHGGTDGAVFARTDTWEWDGVAWVQRHPTAVPPAVLDPVLAFDPVRRRCLRFGGFDGTAARAETWSYGPAVSADAVPYGSGCAGSAGVPRLAAHGGLPWLGDVVVVEVRGLPPTAPAVVHVGYSDTVWGAVPLPIRLDPLGMPGCSIFASIDAISPLANQGGTARFALPVPVDANLIGGRLFVQAIAIDPPANPFGATTTNGLALTIGAR